MSAPRRVTRASRRWRAGPARRVLAVAVAMLAAAAARAGEAPPVGVTTQLSRASAGVRDTIRYTVTVATAPEVEVDFPAFPDTIAGFMVTQFGDLETSETAGRTVRSRWYDLRHYLAGSYTLPGITVEYQLPGKPKALLRSADMFVQIQAPDGRGAGSAAAEFHDDSAGPIPATSRYLR